MSFISSQFAPFVVSCILFDSQTAIIAGTPTIAFNFAKSEYGDYYGYVANGILRFAHNTEYLISNSENNNAGFHSVPIIT